jgi:hypothetical protein
MGMKKTHAQKKRTALELQTEIAQFTQQVSQFFNKRLTEELARETGFVERESKLTGHLFLSVFTFGMSIYGTPSLNELVGLLNIVVPELDLTRQALHERINEEAVAFFEKMLSLAVTLELPKRLSQAVEKLCPQFNRILIFDSTSFQLPAELANYFRGSGGGGSEAAVKILFGYDFKSYQFCYRLQDGVAHDQLHLGDDFQQIKAGDLEISDLGFFNIEAFADLDQKGAFYLSRLRSDIRLYHQTRDRLEEFDLVGFAKKLHAGQTEVEVYLKKGNRLLKTHLIIEPVPDQVKAQRLRKINHVSRKKGYQPRKRVKILAGFNLYITNAPAADIPRELLRSLYRIRWQIELVFKNWKSNFALAKVTGKRPERVKCMIYAKLLFIVITTKICAAARNYVWATAHREISCFQAAKHLKSVALPWLVAIVQHPKSVANLLTNALAFIMKHCLKGKSNKRTYPLVVLAEIQAGLA